MVSPRKCLAMSEYEGPLSSPEIGGAQFYCMVHEGGSRDKALAWLATQMPLNPARTVYSRGCNPQVDHTSPEDPAPTAAVIAVEVAVEEAEYSRRE